MPNWFAPWKFFCISLIFLLTSLSSRYPKTLKKRKCLFFCKTLTLDKSKRKHSKTGKIRIETGKRSTKSWNISNINIMTSFSSNRANFFLVRLSEREFSLAMDSLLSSFRSILEQLTAYSRLPSKPWPWSIQNAEPLVLRPVDTLQRRWVRSRCRSGADPCREVESLRQKEPPLSLRCSLRGLQVSHSSGHVFDQASPVFLQPHSCQNFSVLSSFLSLCCK